MSYNIIGIAEKEPNWKELHSDVFNPVGAIEMFPIDQGDGKFYLGLSIPSKNIETHPNLWQQLEEVINQLRNKHGFQVFDLYGGFYVDQNNLAKLKKQLIG